MSATFEDDDIDGLAEELRLIDRRERNAWRRHYRCIGDNLCADCEGRELIPTHED